MKARRWLWRCRTCGTISVSATEPIRHPCGGVGSFLHNWERTAAVGREKEREG